MIEWSDALLAISEIAITITGFSGLIGLLARRERIGRSSIEFYRLRWMLEYSLLVLGLSLLPFLIFAGSLSEENGWRLSSALALCALVVYVLANRRFLSDFKRRATAFERTFGLIDLVFAGILLANSLGFPFDPNALPYLGVVYWNLVGATVGFIRLIALTWSRPADGSDDP